MIDAKLARVNRPRAAGRAGWSRPWHPGLPDPCFQAGPWIRSASAKFRRRFSITLISAHRRPHCSAPSGSGGGTSGGVVSTPSSATASSGPGAPSRTSGSRGGVRLPPTLMVWARAPGATSSTQSTSSQAAASAGPTVRPSSSSRFPSGSSTSKTAASACGAFRLSFRASRSGRGTGLPSARSPGLPPPGQSGRPRPAGRGTGPAGQSRSRRRRAHRRASRASADSGSRTTGIARPRHRCPESLRSLAVKMFPSRLDILLPCTLRNSPCSQYRAKSGFPV